MPDLLPKNPGLLPSPRATQLQEKHTRLEENVQVQPVASMSAMAALDTVVVEHNLSERPLIVRRAR